MPALLLATFAAPAEPSDPALLDRIANAPWAEGRGHAAIEDDAERHQAILRDLRIDEALAGRLLDREGFETPDWIADRLESRRRELLREVPRLIAQAQVQPSEEEIERVIEERNFRRVIPSHYAFSYLLLEVPDEATSEQQDALAQLARDLATEATPRNFADFARLWSDAPSATRGGHMGSMPLERVGPTFSEALLATEPGTVGGPYELPSGWALIHLQSVSEERPFLPEEQLPDMATGFLVQAWLEEQHASLGGPDAFMEEYAVPDHPAVRVELEAYRDFLLAHEYLRQRLQSEGREPTGEDLRPIHERQVRLYERRFRHLAREIVLTSPEWTTADSQEGWAARRAVRDGARELREEILAGDLSFTDAAREYSISSTAEEGGLLGWLQPPTDATIDRTLAALEPGEVSVPLQRRDGFALLYLEEREQVTAPSLEELRDWLVEQWINREARLLRERLVEEGDVP